jgi:aminoacrylate hydrolase
MGGAVAQVIGKNYPDAARTLVMSNSLMKFNPLAEIIFQETLALYQQDKSATVIMEHLAPHIFSKAFYTPALIDFIRRVTANNPYPQTQQGFERQLTALRLFDSREWIGEITLPTLLIASTEDKISPLSESEQMAAKIKNARLYITDTGHASFVEAPKLFCQAINEFIAA